LSPGGTFWHVRAKPRAAREEPPRATNRPRPGLRWRRASGPLWARLDHVQVAALAAQAGSYGIFIRTLAYTGLRWGEATALRVRDVDINRRRLDVRRAYSTISGALIEGTPKSHQQRTVPLPKKLCEELAAHIDGLGPDDHVFTTASGTPVRTTNFRRRTWLPAVAATGLHGLTPHGLRHTAASLYIAAGTPPKVVQRILGHASISITLDLYGHLYPDEMDTWADRLGDIADNAMRPDCVQDGEDEGQE
jgi:integrase